MRSRNRRTDAIPADRCDPETDRHTESGVSSRRNETKRNLRPRRPRAPSRPLPQGSADGCERTRCEQTRCEQTRCEQTRCEQTRCERTNSQYAVLALCPGWGDRGRFRKKCLLYEQILLYFIIQQKNIEDIRTIRQIPQFFHEKGNFLATPDGNITQFRAGIPRSSAHQNSFPNTIRVLSVFSP